MKIVLALALSLSSALAAPPSANKAEATPKPCDDAGQVYRICSDQAQTFQTALQTAQEKKKDLVISFGAQWCPWCQSLHKILDPKQGEAWGKTHQLLEIGLFQGEEEVPSGFKVLDQTMAFANVTKKPAGIPILAVVDPAKKKAVLIDTEKLEKNENGQKGHDPAKVFSAIQAASDSLHQKK